MLARKKARLHPVMGHKRALYPQTCPRHAFGNFSYRGRVCMYVCMYVCMPPRKQSASERIVCELPATLYILLYNILFNISVCKDNNKKRKRKLFYSLTTDSSNHFLPMGRKRLWPASLRWAVSVPFPPWKYFLRNSSSRTFMTQPSS